MLTRPSHVVMIADCLPKHGALFHHHLFGYATDFFQNWMFLIREKKGIFHDNSEVFIKNIPQLTLIVSCSDCSLSSSRSENKLKDNA